MGITTLLQIHRQFDGALDVLLLRRLVATRQKHDQLFAALRVIDAVSRPDIDPQFGNPVSQIAVIARVAMDKTIDPNLDLRALLSRRPSIQST